LKGVPIKKIAFAALALALSAFSTPGYSQNFNQKFDSRGHPKSMGLWFTVRYPEGWQALEGERPHIVRKFRFVRGAKSAEHMVQVRDMGPDGSESCKATTAREFQEIFSESGSGTSAADVRKSEHEGQPAFFYTLTTKASRVGIQYELVSRVMAVCYQDKMIQLWCAQSTMDRASMSVKSTNEDLAQSAPVCLQFFNSLVLMDRY